MTSRSLLLAAALLPALTSATRAGDAPPAAKPNVVFILAAAIGEKTDRAAAQPEKAKELHEKLQAWRQSVSAPMPRPKTPADEAAGKQRKRKKEADDGA